MGRSSSMKKDKTDELSYNVNQEQDRGGGSKNKWGRRKQEEE